MSTLNNMINDWQTINCVLLCLMCVNSVMKMNMARINAFTKVNVFVFLLKLRINRETNKVILGLLCHESWKLLF